MLIRIYGFPEKKKFFIDEDYVQILGIKMENKNLIAVVEKKNDGKNS